MILVENDDGQKELIRDRIRVFPRAEQYLTQVPKGHPLAVGLEEYVNMFVPKKV